MVTLAQMIGDARGEIEEIGPTEASDAVERGEISMILDVREPNEFRDSHLPDAVNIPRGLLEIRADPNSPAKDESLSANPSARVLLYCTKNPSARSLLAAQTLSRMGYERAQVLGGGLNAWAESGLPVERAQQPAA
jgi:rhodanese-related sulfurtransferase